MDLNKRKYSKKEVEKIITELSAEYEENISAIKAQNSELSRENSALNLELDAYKRKDKQISGALKRAEAYSDELKQKAEMQYSLAVEKISMFLDKWQAYFNYLQEKYPMYPVVQEAEKLKEQITKIIGKKDDETVIYAANKTISGLKNAKAGFNPKEKIADYIAATENDGFNMDEVLNPGALKLEDLCKELGLLAENE